MSEALDVEVELPYVREVGGVVPTGRDELGLGAGRVRWAANLAAAYEAGELELIAHLGYMENRNRLGERRSRWHLSAAVLYSVTEDLRLLADYARDTDPGPSRVCSWVVGATYALGERADLGLGYGKTSGPDNEERMLRAGFKLRW